MALTIMYPPLNPNPKNVPSNPDGTRGWSNPLFGCFGDLGTCRFSLTAFVLVKSHLWSQVSPPHSAPASCSLGSRAGLNILSIKELPINTAALFALTLALGAVVFLVLRRLVSSLSPISAAGRSNHPIGSSTKKHSRPLQHRRYCSWRLPHCLLLPCLRPRPGLS